MRKKRFGGLPLFWKVLLPFLGLIVLLGATGAFLIVRDLSQRTQTAIDRDLSRQSLDARSLAHDRELYLLESANFAANIQGMAAAVDADDARAVARLLGSVLALKTDLDLVLAADVDGKGLVEYRMSGSETPERSSGGSWASNGFVRDAIADAKGGKHSGFLIEGGRTMLAIAAPVCPPARACRATGVTIAAISIDRIANEAAGRVSPSETATRGRAAVEIYDNEGRLIAATGFPGLDVKGPASAPPSVTSSGLVRRTERVGGVELATLYAPYEVQGRSVGILAVSFPSELAFDSVRSTGIRLALVLLAVMAGVIGIGALLSRFILSQVRPLLETNRALGRGELTARAPVIADDELGELARGVNQMAEQLQASYETLELRVAQRTEEVRRLLAERTEFFAAMSHDFRTPLAVILSQADMITDPGYRMSSKETAEAGMTIKESGAQVLALVNDVLELARAEAGRLEVALEEVRLTDVVGDLRGTMEGLARGGDLSLAIDVPRDLPLVHADRRRLREVILNLVDNAVKYTPPGGRVALSAAAHNGDVEVLVADSGVGIPSEAGNKIFEPFYRVKGTLPARGQASTGLGLALTKRLVEAHGGAITFESVAGQGTTFRFTLSTAGAHAKPRRKRPTASSRQGSPSS